MFACREARGTGSDVDVAGASTGHAVERERDDIGEVASPQKPRIECAHSDIGDERHREFKRRHPLGPQHRAGDPVNGGLCETAAAAVARHMHVDACLRSHASRPARRPSAPGFAARAAQAHAPVSASVA